MSELKKYAASELAGLDDSLFNEGEEFSVYLATDVEQAFVPFLEHFIQNTERWTFQYDEAQRLLASLKG